MNHLPVRRLVLLLAIAVLLTLHGIVSGFGFHHSSLHRPFSPRRRKQHLSTTLSAESPSVSSSPEPRILCVGEALLDCISNQNGLSSEDMITRGAWTAFPGGASANVATACCKLGSPTGFCGSVGQDQDGDFLQRELKQCGVHVSLLQRHSHAPTRRVMVTRDGDGERSFAGFHGNLATDRFADCYLTATESNDDMDSLLDSLEWIACGTLSLAYPQSSQAIYEIVNRACAAGAKLCVDVNWRPIFWQCHETKAKSVILKFVQKAHVVKLTNEEAEWLLENVTATEALEHPERVHKRHFPNALAVFVTAGELGASWSTLDHTTGFSPAFQVDAIDTTGAGDGFLAGILHGLVSQPNLLRDDNKKDEWKDLVSFASAVGALTCTSEGAIAAQPTMADVESFLIHGQKLWA